MQRRKSESTETALYIRKQTLDEALPKLDQFLDASFMAGRRYLTIVHGKGTGVLAEAVHNVLKKHPLVQSYRFGEYGEGGSGVTIVILEIK